jgi:hypothetical protein
MHRSSIPYLIRIFPYSSLTSCSRVQGCIPVIFLEILSVAEPGFRPRGGMKIFLGRHSGVFNRSGKNVYVNFLTTFFYSFLLFFEQHHPRGGGGAVRGVLGAPSLLARAPGGHDAPCPPWLRHCSLHLETDLTMTQLDFMRRDW